MSGEYHMHVTDGEGIGTTTTFEEPTPNEAVVHAHESLEAFNNCNPTIVEGELYNSAGEHLGTVVLDAEK